MIHSQNFQRKPKRRRDSVRGSRQLNDVDQISASLELFGLKINFLFLPQTNTQVRSVSQGSRIQVNIRQVYFYPRRKKQSKKTRMQLVHRQRMKMNHAFVSMHKRRIDEWMDPSCPNTYPTS